MTMANECLHTRFNCTFVPTGYVLNGASVRIDPQIAVTNVGSRLLNTASSTKTAKVLVYNDVIYTTSARTTAYTQVREYQDGHGNTIHEYSIDVNGKSQKGIYEGADATWVILKDSPYIWLSAAISGSGTSSINYKKHKVYLQESLNLVSEEDVNSFQCTYCSLDKPFDIAGLSGFVNITSLQLSGTRDFYGDINVLRNNAHPDTLAFYASYSNVSGSLDGFLDDVAAALVAAGSITGEYLDKSYGFDNTQITVKGSTYTVRPTVRFYPNGTWTVL